MRHASVRSPKFTNSGADSPAEWPQSPKSHSVGFAASSRRDAEDTSIETQRIERPVRVTPKDESQHALGVPFAPPVLDDVRDEVQVIELEGAAEKASNDGSSQLGGQRVSDIIAHLRARDYLYYLFEGFPSHLYRKRTLNWIRASEVVNNFILLVVLLSCFSFSAETLPQYFDRDLESFNIIEIVCIATFTVDFVIRAALVRERLRFVRSVQNWIDFISILPFYIALIVGDNSGAGALIMLRTLRLMRVFRILKLSKRNVGLQAVVEAMFQSSEAISLLTFLLMIATVLFSSAMFFAEQTGSTFDNDRQMWIRDNGQISPFQSIFHTMWWCIVTMTTVGYGDDVPITPLGKVIGSVTMLCGVFVLAFPTVILSTNFQEVHQARIDQHKQTRHELNDLSEVVDGMSSEDDDDGIFAEGVTLDLDASVAVFSNPSASAENNPLAGKRIPRVDPRFAALVDRLQTNYTKYTRFGYTFNPYASREAALAQNTKSMRRHRGSAMLVSRSRAQSIIVSLPVMNPDGNTLVESQSSAFLGTGLPRG
jgi:hypothetical protein